MRTQRITGQKRLRERYPEKYQAALKRRRLNAPKRTYANSLVPLASRGYRFNSTELKEATTAATSYQINTTGSFTLLAAPVPGTDMTNRIGRKVVLKNFYIRGYLATEWADTGPNVDSNLVVQAQMARMIVFVDQQPNGAAPAVTDLLTAASSVAMLNLNNRDRFKILVDKQYVLGPIGIDVDANTVNAVAVAPQIIGVKKWKPCNVEMIFNTGSAGTIADVTSGALYMFWIGDQVAGTNTDARATLTTRVRFADP